MVNNAATEGSEADAPAAKKAAVDCVITEEGAAENAGVENTVMWRKTPRLSLPCKNILLSP